MTNNSKYDLLSKREKELIEWLGKGLSRSEISDRMNVSIHTYDGYRKSIRIKLQIKNQADWARVLMQVS